MSPRRASSSPLAASCVLLLFLLLLLLLAPVPSLSKRIKDRIYVDLKADRFCFRRTNGTHQFGCTSDIEGNVGVVHLVQGQEDIEWIVRKGPHFPYTAVFTPKTFNKANLKRLSSSGKLSGAVLLAPEGQYQLPEEYSDERSCPNPDSSLYKGTPDDCRPDRQPWNPAGEGLMFESLDFPVLLVTGNSTAESIVTDCFERFNRPGPGGKPRQWPLCAMELASHMFAAVDTETCLRRGDILNIIKPVKFCDEMGDSNTFLFLRERNLTEPEDRVTVVATRMDTFTMFDRAEFGGDSPVTGIVTLLELARMLAKDPPDFTGKTKNILFALFYGESFDYIGSSRFVYDVKSGKFPDPEDEAQFPSGQQPPLTLDSVDLFLEVGQVYNDRSSSELFAHMDGQMTGKEEVLSRLKLRAARGRTLPPSSAHAYLKEAGRSSPAVLIADFDESYTNRYYHSIYDDGERLDYSYDAGEDQAIVERISNLAENLASFLWGRSQRSGPNVRFSSNRTVVNELLHCYLDTAACKLFFESSNANTPPFYSAVPAKSPWPMYVGVDIKPQYHGILTRNVLAYLTGEVVDPERRAADCKTESGQNIRQSIFLKGDAVPDWWEGDRASCNASAECGHCYRTLSFRRRAISPAFVIKDYDYSSPQYGAWAESVWKSVQARVFLKASPSSEYWYFALGVIVTVLSFLAAFWADRYSCQIFVARESPSAQTTTSSVPGASGVEPAEL